MRFNIRGEDENDYFIAIESKKIPVNENRNYDLSVCARGSLFINDGIDYLYLAVRADLIFLDNNNIELERYTSTTWNIDSTEEWKRFDVFNMSAAASAGAVSAVVKIGVEDLRQVLLYPDPNANSYLEISCVQLEESPYRLEDRMTDWEDNYVFTVKPPEEHKVIYPVYIKNPRIYRADGTLFFKLDTTILNTEKIVYDTENFMCYIEKENGQKINKLDDVFVYIFNKLPPQLLSSDKFYLRYSDESGEDRNTGKPVQVKVKIDWAAQVL